MFHRDWCINVEYSLRIMVISDQSLIYFVSCSIFNDGYFGSYLIMNCRFTTKGPSSTTVKHQFIHNILTTQNDDQWWIVMVIWWLGMVGSWSVDDWWWKPSLFWALLMADKYQPLWTVPLSQCDPRQAVTINHWPSIHKKASVTIKCKHHFVITMVISSLSI